MSTTTTSVLGFEPHHTGSANRSALQNALDELGERGGTLRIEHPGLYELAGTVYVGSRTTLLFGNGVVIRKTNESGGFSHVILNKGALTKTWDRGIRIEGLRLQVNGVDVRSDTIPGLRGQVALFYAADSAVRGFRCDDLGPQQFAVHVCTFEDLIVEDCIIRGDKDGVHLGRGRRFVIRDCVFQTRDDAVALNAHDYATSNPELGWIEQGVVERCWDLPAPADDTARTVGYFCRILAGSWGPWRKGMSVQQSDTVVAGDGRLYRVQAEPDGKLYTSNTRPEHHEGVEVLDGIPWGVVQDDAITSAGVRDVVFREITLEKPRVSFSVHFDCDRYSRSYYPGSEPPMQEGLRMEGLRVKHGEALSVVRITTPIDVLSLRDSRLGPQSISFGQKPGFADRSRTVVRLTDCVFTHDGPMTLLEHTSPGKPVRLETHGSVVSKTTFTVHINTTEQNPAIETASDLPGLA